MDNRIENYYLHLTIYRKKLSFFLIVICSTVTMSFLSCKKFVEIDPPQTELVTETVFKNTSTATAALTAIYGKMVSNNLTYDLPFYTGLYGDELLNYSTSPFVTAFYQNNMNGVDAFSNIWSQGYSLIYQANAVLEGCEQSKELHPQIKQQLMAEAKFIRAYWFFYLVHLYGDVPLTLKTDYLINSKMSRVSADQVYEQIILDLKDAQGNLNENYVDNTDTTITSERVRPNKFAATALLARVYLYKNRFSEAEIEASTVINKTTLYDTVSFNSTVKVFDKNSKEAIWQIPPSITTTYNTREGDNFILTARPTNSTLSSYLLNSFETGDKRRVNWTKILTVGTETFVYPYKYKVKGSSTVTEYSMALRLAEQYLIRAEAKAQQGKVLEAQSDLNVIRKRAGLSVTTATTKETLLDAILQERRVELFTEWGHRWLDLKRTGKVEDIMLAIAPTKGATWVSYKQYWPIPQTDITNNPDLKQTDGYNK